MSVSARLNFDALYGGKDAGKPEMRVAEHQIRSTSAVKFPRIIGCLEAGKLVASSAGTAILSIDLILTGPIDFFVEIPRNTLGCRNELRGI
jgi:hypothetical protein